MPNYDNETCYSCQNWMEAGCEPDDPATDHMHIRPGAKRCKDGFAPSLECRKVLALESIACDLEDFRGCLRDDGHGGCTFDVTQ